MAETLRRELTRDSPAPARGHHGPLRSMAGTPVVLVAADRNDDTMDDPQPPPPLAGRIRERIRRKGPLAFPDFMEMALYDPGEGYYARGTDQVGRGGDFFTSVSVGPLFGRLLARRFLRQWDECGKPSAWRIVECGAHDGTLAADVLTELAALSPNAYAGLEYRIVEPLPTLRAAQEVKLAGFARMTGWTTDPSELPRLPGIVFGNELLDALPFHTLEFQNGAWRERCVGLDADGGFRWEARDIGSPGLAAAAACMGLEFPEGYLTELRAGLPGFLTPLARVLDGGLMLWADYGFVREDYLHPSRSTGTLRTFARHRAAEDPLAAPGACDITAHVDFTAVAEAMESLGGRVSPLRNQGSWLTEVARDWLSEQEGAPDAALLRQFQTLTHPGHLGRSFQVIEARF